MFNPREDFYEQSSSEIWQAVLSAIKGAMRQAAKTGPLNIQGLGFDATCSLVVLDENEKPISISQTGEMNRNVVRKRVLSIFLSCLVWPVRLAYFTNKRPRSGTDVA